MAAPRINGAGSGAPPPSYEEAIGIPPGADSPAAGHGTSTLAVPQFGRPNGNSRLNSDRRSSMGSNVSVQTRESSSAGRPASWSALPNGNPRSQANGNQPPQVAAFGSVARGPQFPPAFNLYHPNFTRSYFFAEHEHTPLYAVRFHFGFSLNKPDIGLHNGPDSETAPLLAAVDNGVMSRHMTITLPPPLSYDGVGPTSVRLVKVSGWVERYAFTMEVGTDLRNVHQESFEWRHSRGSTIAALDGVLYGWKLLRMSSQALPGAPPPQLGVGNKSSDGREVVAVYSSARRSFTKQFKFAFVGTGLTGALGERWSVMAVTSALAMWKKEEDSRAAHRMGANTAMHSNTAMH
ncbi:hypothetical protein SEPCBS119000_000948 [Sporothrix epigloea]|uniref:Uncharacterized protein n=1 Tax=Sporothrix epigloea TaxID=1892477 RepID=A0ABP0DAH8_9PEZI